MSSTYHGRRAPNVSQYIADLNSIPSTHDLASASTTAQDISLGEGDLDFLTHAEFFDFDSFHPNNVDFNPAGARDGEAKGRGIPINGPQYQFGEFQAYPAPVGSSPGAHRLHEFHPPGHSLYGHQTGDKRKASVSGSIPSGADLEEDSRIAAEEDKRRRNTAASARFRVKKKQREQALEKQAKEMSDKVSQLEGKVQQLEMENKWLKGLITDKNDGKSLETMQKEKDAEDRKTDDHTTGVGTEEDDEVKSEA